MDDSCYDHKVDEQIGLPFLLALLVLAGILGFFEAICNGMTKLGCSMD